MLCYIVGKWVLEFGGENRGMGWQRTIFGNQQQFDLYFLMQWGKINPLTPSTYILRKFRGRYEEITGRLVPLQQ